MAPSEVKRAEIVGQLRALGVEAAGVLLVHTSFRRVRPVEGGPQGLIAGLRESLGPQGTLVMPSWSENDDQPFDPATSSASPSLGAVADVFWQLPQVLRSSHNHAFAAVGPRAAEIVAGPLPIPPHGQESPVGRVYDADGQVLLLGAGHEANTTLHLAELLAGVPYGVPTHCTVLQAGKPVRIDYLENNHCCQRFALADGWLRARGLQSEGSVGHASARLFKARQVVELALPRLARDLLLFLHPWGVCRDCDLARNSAKRG